jgi:hypothetical protein
MPADPSMSHTEYARTRFTCAGCGATLPVEKRAGGRLCVACRAARAD